jgi:surface polysaccharide O-acyltransferase-like enzyme
VLLAWTLIDGVLSGHWVAQLIQRRSLAPLLWNVIAIPSFALRRPDLFLFRGTAIPLWFLVSLIVAVSLLALCIKLQLRPTVLALLALSAYTFTLLVSFYANTALGMGLVLPLEQRGPLIAFAFLIAGYLIATGTISMRIGTSALFAIVILVFAESALMSHLARILFVERPYLFSTFLLGCAVFLFAVQHPSFGAKTVLPRIGRRSLGIYVVHTSVLNAIAPIRSAVVHPLWECLLPVAVLTVSYAITLVLSKIPYVRVIVA